MPKKQKTTQQTGPDTLGPPPSLHIEQEARKEELTLTGAIEQAFSGGEIKSH